MSGTAVHEAPAVAAGGAASCPWQPIVQDRAFDLQLRFNLYPATYAHASWIARISRHFPQAEGLAEAGDSPFWMRRLSLALLRARNLERDVDFDFSRPAKNVALLDAPVLERCARLMAGLLVRDQIRHVVRGADVMAIERTLGRETHRFVLGWTAALPGLGFTFHRRGDAFPDSERWTRHAVGLVSALLADGSPGTLARMQLRFPYDWARYKCPELQDEDCAKLTELFVAVLKQAEPEHAWLFAAQEREGAGPAHASAAGGMAQ